MPVRIGYVKYLNTLPLIHGLESWREVELHAAVPAKLVGMLTGETAGAQTPSAPSIDIGLCSLIDAVRSRVPLTLLPVGMIGCDGPTLTVRLFSRVPLEQVETVHADTDSHTSVALCQVLMARRFGRAVKIRDFDARERMAVGNAAGAEHAGEWPDTLLMIGDKVVTDSPPAVRYPHQLDLGEAWKQWTGLPFVYAVWMCRAADREREDIRAAASVLERQRLRNAVRLDWLVDRFAQERAWPADLARRYLGEYLRYGVGAREREAVSRFLSECAAIGIAPAQQPTWSEIEGGAAPREYAATEAPGVRG